MSSLETNLNVIPYHDDYEFTKDYYKFLFKKGVSVQVRELNSLQTMLQKQIEMFGSNILSKGTIVDGCNFSFNNSLPYIKINDFTANGVAAIPANYKGMHIENTTTGLEALVFLYKDGFESSDPDLKTLYLKYLNRGSNGSVNTFTAGDSLKIKDFDETVEEVIIVNGSQGFSNNDTVLFSSALVVNNSTGTLANGDYINDGSLANVEIVGIDTTTLASANQIILSVQARDVDLANSSANASYWTIANGSSIQNTGNTASGTVEKVIGASAAGRIETNGTGKITDIIMTNKGSGYSTAPVVRVISPDNAAGLTSLELTSKNYVANVTVSSLSSSVGNGYSFSVSDGIVFQKGYFLRVAEQSIIVEKYSQTPNAVVAVFESTEEIVNQYTDDSLFDNATEAKNFNAPGADRMKITPQLKILPRATVQDDPSYFTLVDWSEGLPYKQQQRTFYNRIEDEMAKRLHDQSGNFVIDEFQVTTRSPANSENEGQYFSTIVDPGRVYIDGYRVETARNFSIDVEKGTDVFTTNNQYVSLDYGNYITVNELGGTFEFDEGATVELWDTAMNFVSNTALTSMTPSGTQLGTAKMRMLSRQEEDLYRLFLFDIQMNQGKNFKDVQCVYYDGTLKGVADVFLKPDVTSSSNVCVLEGKDRGGLLFYSGAGSLKDANNVYYQYRTVDEAEEVSNTGSLSKSLSGVGDERFPYSASANLSDSQLRKLVVVPIAGALTANQTINEDSGEVFSVSTSAATANGSGGTINLYATHSGNSFPVLKVGDYVKFTGNSTESDTKRVVQITNSTQFVVDSNIGFVNTTAQVYRTFPNNQPIPFGWRDGLYANCDATQDILTLNFGVRFDHAGTVNTALTVDVERTDVTAATKSPTRNKWVMVVTANNTGGNNGPWCLGVSDAFRLRNVYGGNDGNINSSSNNITSNFYIDNNQNKDYCGLSYLYLKPKSQNVSNGSSYFLVEFDYYNVSTPGYYDVTSYVSANLTTRMLVDSQPLSNLTSTVSSWEIPEVLDDDGTEYDLMQQFDFRPIAANTVAPAASDVTGNTVINPSETLSFASGTDKKFPVPESTMRCDLEQFVGRTDTAFVNKRGIVGVKRGTPALEKQKRTPPMIGYGNMNIADIAVPPYPALPVNRSSKLLQVTGASRSPTSKRINRVTVAQVANNQNRSAQIPGYSMKDIAKMDARLRDMEYYVALNALETKAIRREILSSVDPTLNRFKSGIFVDDFRDYQYIDRQNLQHNAIIEDDDLIPHKMAWTAEFFGIRNGCAYVDEPLLSQNFATTARAEELPDCVPNTNTGNVLAWRTQNFQGEVGNTVSDYADTYNVTMAATGTGTATLYYQGYDKYIRVEVYRGSTLIANTAGASVLTASDKTFVTSSEAAGWFVDRQAQYLIDTDISSGYARYAGKLSWSHNPDNGRIYTIRILKGAGSFEWKWLLDYPVDRNTVGCPPPPAPPPPPPPPEEPEEPDWRNEQDDDDGDDGC